LFWLQVRPTLPDAPALPKDYLVLIDTSASKAAGPLAVSVQIAHELATKLGEQDRMAVWTANVKPRDVSRGFKEARGLEAAYQALLKEAAPGTVVARPLPAALEDTFKELAKEVPLGAVNLKKTLTEALASFEVNGGRQRVIVYLGDGKSVAE